VTGAGVECELAGEISPATLEHVCRAMVGMTYWFMVWRVSKARRYAVAMYNVVTEMHRQNGATPLRLDPIVQAAVRGASRMVE